MIFVKDEDVNRCIDIVKNELNKKGIEVDSDILSKISEEIMNICYSKGGDYSNKIIQSFSETYVEEKLYLKYLNE